MNPNDTISVLICVHSVDKLHDHLLDRAIKSLKRQTYQDFEIVVVADECWRPTIQLLDDHKVKYYIKPNKEGLALAKNIGIKQCSGSWIMYLDADDEYMDCKVEVQRQFMVENPQFDFVFTQAWDRDENGKLRPNCFKIGQYKGHVDIASRLPFENVLCHGSACIRKSILDKLGGYDTSRNFLGCEDWHLWLKAIRSGHQFFNIPERLYIYSLGTSVER